MGEAKNNYIDVQFNKKLKIGLKGSEVTSDGGLLAIREMDEKLGLTEIAGKYLEDNRYGKNIQHEMTGLLRQSVYSRLGGYRDELIRDLFYRKNKSVRELSKEFALCERRIWQLIKDG